MIPDLNLKVLKPSQRKAVEYLISTAQSNFDVTRRHKIIWKAWKEIPPSQLKSATRKEKKFIFIRVEMKHKHSDIYHLVFFRRYQDCNETCLGSMTLEDSHLVTMPSWNIPTEANCESVNLAR